jgi:restriction system protein
MTDFNLPKPFRFVIPITEVLKETGGSGKTGEVIDLVIEKEKIPDEELQKKRKNGMPIINNQIHWSSWILSKMGLLDKSNRGVWSLTEKGLNKKLSIEDLQEFHNERKRIEKEERQKKKLVIEDSDKDTENLVSEDQKEEDELDEIFDYKAALLNILQELPPPGFERICQRLLRESGFEQVTVTGKSGDGGIDGIGILQVNPFVSFKVLFQCKRYQGSVTPSQVRDFRGAMIGRADKGIIMTTGTFTTEAKREARREGVSPIEIVDGEKIVEMFETLELGLKPTKTYEIDEKFFDEFKS